MKRSVSRRFGRRTALFALMTTLAAPSIVAPILVSAAHAQLDSAPMASPLQTIRVFLNGREVSFDGVAPIQESGRTLVPMRGVFEALGAYVEFNAATQLITATKAGTRVQLTLGSTVASVNGQNRVLDVPARAVGGRTLVPLRFAAESFGVTADWNPNTRIINLSSGLDAPDIAPITTEVSGNVLRYDSDTGVISLRLAEASRSYTISNNARFFRRTTGRLIRGENPIFGAPVATTESALVQGADVVLQLNARNEVTRATISTSVLPVRIRDVQGDTITLDDSRDTTLMANSGSGVRVYDARGRQTDDASTLVPGQQVALFITPSTRRPFAVSAAPADVTLANNAGNDLPYDGGTDNPDVAGTPQINLVQHNATRALRAGQTLQVTVRGTPNARGTFSIVPEVPETNLIEDRARPGVYTGSYVVQTGDNILNGRVSATLRSTNGREAFQQSQSSVTIDTVAPRITGTSPANGATINNRQPSIVINANDIGGSGLGSATVSINGQQVATEDITIASNAITVVNTDNLNGQVNINATVLDRAGNAARRSFSFFVGDEGGGVGNNSDITSFSSNATGDVQIGDRVTVDLRAPIGGRANVDILSSRNRAVVQTVRLSEVSDGRYRATFSVPDSGDSSFILLARYTDIGGNVSTQEASARLFVADANGDSGGNNSGGVNDRITITSPRESDRVADAIVISGRAEPNTTVDVNVTAQGTRYLVFEYSNDLGTQQVQTDNSGNWSTASIALPRPNNVSNLRFTVSATQTDSAGNRSEPVTVAVTPR